MMSLRQLQQQPRRLRQLQEQLRTPLLCWQPLAAARYLHLQQQRRLRTPLLCPTWAFHRSSNSRSSSSRLVWLAHHTVHHTLQQVLHAGMVCLLETPSRSLRQPGACQVQQAYHLQQR